LEGNIKERFFTDLMKKYKLKFSADAKQVYDFLSEEAKKSKLERMLLDAINTKIEFIKADIRYGDPIAKKLIPKEYKKKYGLSNLFRVELPVFWRMLYTNIIENDEVEVVAFVIEILHHQEYNKRFGYKKK
jgi:hypothetical protein